MPKSKTKSKTNRATYNSKDVVDKVFNAAKPIKDKDPTKYRQDPYKNQIYKGSYGKDSEQGWNTDHIKPKNRGGSDDIINLQALQSQKNKEKEIP